MKLTTLSFVYIFIFVASYSFSAFAQTPSSTREIVAEQIVTVESIPRPRLGEDQGGPVTSRPARRQWGVYASDPTLDLIREKLINQVGITNVVTARISSAINRMKILDSRATTLIKNTSNECTFKTVAEKELATSRALYQRINSSELLLAENRISTTDTDFKKAEGSIEDKTNANTPLSTSGDSVLQQNVSSDGKMITDVTNKTELYGTQTAIDPVLVRQMQTTLDGSLIEMKKAVNTISRCPQYDVYYTNVQTSTESIPRPIVTEGQVKPEEQPLP